MKLHYVRVQQEAKAGRLVNVLNLTRSLAVDVVSTHLFQENCNGISKKEVGCLFLLLWMRSWLAAFSTCQLMYTHELNGLFDKLVPDEHTYNSIEIVDKFRRQSELSWSSHDIAASGI